MREAFLIIISLVGTAVAVWTKQGRIALGLFILTIAFVLFIPDLATGIMADILNALSLILFLAGMIVIVWKKKETQFFEKEMKEVEKEI